VLSEVFKERLWTKDFINTSVVNFALMMSQYLLLVTITMYAIEEYGASIGLAGLVSSSFIIVSLFGRFFGVCSIASVGSKRMLVISSFFVLIVVLLCLYFKCL